jgi:alpha-N-acetylglucosaminidase
LTVDRVSSWGGTEIFYNPDDVREAARLLLEADLSGENYYFDLIEISRQALMDYACFLLKDIKKSYENSDADVDSKCKMFLNLIKDIDKLLNTNENFMLGQWTQMARAIADEMDGTTESDKDWLELNNARTLITTWGDEINANQGGLRDYSYRAWGGMLKDFYYPRWKYFFENDLQLPEDGWFAMERKWALDKTFNYSDKPQGDTKKVLKKIWKRY